MIMSVDDKSNPLIYMHPENYQWMNIQFIGQQSATGIKSSLH